MLVKREYGYLREVEAAVKAARSLGMVVVKIEALGTWRTLRPVDGVCLDFEGPFDIKRGAGPAFVRHDGAEVFMLNDTSLVRLHIETGES